MDRWRGVFKVPFSSQSSSLCKIAASLRISPISGTLIAPSANAIFFNGDRVDRTGNPVIDRLSNLQNIADLIVSKFGDSVNAWVLEASTFNGPFAVYSELIPSVNKWGNRRLTGLMVSQPPPPLLPSCPTSLCSKQEIRVVKSLSNLLFHLHLLVNRRHSCSVLAREAQSSISWSPS